jgi:hypothetical protein
MCWQNLPTVKPEIDPTHYFIHFDRIISDRTAPHPKKLRYTLFSSPKVNGRSVPVIDGCKSFGDSVLRGTVGQGSKGQLCRCRRTQNFVGLPLQRLEDNVRIQYPVWRWMTDRRLHSCGLHGLTTLHETRKLFRYETGTSLSCADVHIPVHGLSWDAQCGRCFRRYARYRYLAVLCLKHFGGAFRHQIIVYHIPIAKLLVSVFNIRWEPELPYQIPRWTQETSWGPEMWLNVVWQDERTVDVLQRVRDVGHVHAVFPPIIIMF